MNRVVATFGLVVLWEISVRALAVPAYILPTPFDIAVRFSEGIPGLSAHIGTTLLEATLGFLLATCVAMLLATVFALSRSVESSFFPFVIALQATPIVAIAPLLIIWFGNGVVPKIIIAALIAFFPLVVTLTRGLRSPPREAGDLFDSLAASKLDTLLRLRIPSSLPFLFAGLRVAAPLSVVGAIVGEFAGANQGLGFFIVVSSHRLETTDMFVGILLSATMSLLLFHVIRWAETWLVPWSQHVNYETD